jgi:hypothetical protein
MLAYGAGNSFSYLVYNFFLFLVSYLNGFGGHSIYFLVFALFFLSSFGFSHSITRGARLVSQYVRLKTHQYLTTVKLCTLSEKYGTHQTHTCGAIYFWKWSHLHFISVPISTSTTCFLYAVIWVKCMQSVWNLRTTHVS